ncbi:MAG: disulfide bond formation protein DsbB [Halioglobus sp.]|jgi:disulfide bond formation protein DsbB
MLLSLPPRTVFFCLSALSALAIVFAVVLERQLGLLPCPLCMTQRAFIVLMGVFALIAALHNPSAWGRRVYGVLCTLAVMAGGAVAARHVWLQYLPKDLVPACGPSLEYMLETLPFSETLNIVLMGDGNCADVVWTLFGFSIPEQTLALFIVLTIICLWQTLRSR